MLIRAGRPPAAVSGDAVSPLFDAAKIADSNPLAVSAPFVMKHNSPSSKNAVPTFVEERDP